MGPLEKVNAAVKALYKSIYKKKSILNSLFLTARVFSYNVK